jgi:hypothetical protein
VVKGGRVLIETGDFHVTTIGDNLPNENELSRQVRHVEFLFQSSSPALSVRRSPADGESPRRPKKAGAAKLRTRADDLLTAKHDKSSATDRHAERSAHGGSGALLKEYFSTLEEARADLMALWNVWDPS